ncbi:CotH kinase family protein [Chitinispirillales bacterium ANBcel5]|uniref:CotH kinase family protein n=1 Tax=Cellulosispirillum alkaliphilum TaxID=3039283 RepID=UPI002A56C6F9|nr:CotH kinase family protein [Chitinispirillales bacterium ANBcel5]
MTLIKRLILASMILSFLVFHSYSQELHLNEIMASNSMTCSDEDGDYEDWIEIYNSSNRAISLEGYGLSDRRDDPFMWIFPAITIEPQGFLLVWASGKDRDDPSGELHSNFRISRSGEWVILTNPDEVRVDELPATEIPTDISIGRYPDGNREGGWHFFENPTPLRTNTTESHDGILDPPEFSQSPGFYNSDIHLSINHPNSEVEIRYTLDGSEPNENSPLYEGPVSIGNRSYEENEIANITTTRVVMGPQFHTPERVDKGTVVRAAAFKDGYVPSPIASGTYFVFPEGNQKFSLPVISVITESDNFFSDSEGIYVPGYNHIEGEDATGNFVMRGDEWEREGNFELFGDDGSLRFSQGVGYRIHGGWSRRFPQKSLRVYARNRYGNRILEHQFFSDRPYDQYRRILLRNSGNDFERTHFKDGALQVMVANMDMETQGFKPTVVFINGEYWGIKNIRDRFDRHYLEMVHGVDPDNVDHLTAMGRSTLEAEVKHGCATHYDEMVQFIVNNDMRVRDNYEKVKTYMDVENYLNYYAIQVFIANTDWPHNNNDFWRLRTDYDPNAPAGHDGRWRWMLYDLDFGLGLWQNDVYTNMLDQILDESVVDNGLFINLMENQDFRFKFINHVADMLNSYFTSDHMLGVMDSIQALIEPEIERHINRWFEYRGMEDWRDDIRDIRQFSRQRQEVVENQLRERFGLGEMREVTLDTDTTYGYIKINSLTINSNLPNTEESVYPWRGSYFSGNPIRLKGAPKEGYQVYRWIVNGHEYLGQEIEIEPLRDIQVEAFFQEAPEEPSRIGNTRSVTEVPKVRFNKNALSFSLSQSTVAQIKLFDLRGRMVKQLHQGKLDAGSHIFDLNSSKVTGGTYLLRIELDNRVINNRINLVQ